MNKSKGGVKRKRFLEGVRRNECDSVKRGKLCLCVKSQSQKDNKAV